MSCQVFVRILKTKVVFSGADIKNRRYLYTGPASLVSAVESSGVVGASGQPQHPHREPVCSLHLPREQGTRAGALLLWPHLGSAAPPNPGAAGGGGGAAVRGIICALAEDLRAGPRVQPTFLSQWGFSGNASALSQGAAPRTRAWGGIWAQKEILVARRAELVGDRMPPASHWGCGVALRVGGAVGGRLITHVLKLLNSLVQGLARVDARSGLLILVLVFGRFLFGWLHPNQDSFHALPALRFCDHELMGSDGRLHLLKLHDGALLGPHLAVPAADPPDIRGQLSPRLEDPH